MRYIHFAGPLKPIWENDPRAYRRQIDLKPSRKRKQKDIKLSGIISQDEAIALLLSRGVDTACFRV
jgi:hypothetical protein